MDAEAWFHFRNSEYVFESCLFAVQKDIWVNKATVKSQYNIRGVK